MRIILMNRVDPLNDLAFAMYDARDKMFDDGRYVYVDTLDYSMFTQTWGSTALGFGGMGGASVTRACVVIVHTTQRHRACVYFGGRHAYTVDNPNDVFFEDMSKRRMVDVKDAGKY